MHLFGKLPSEKLGLAPFGTQVVLYWYLHPVGQPLVSPSILPEPASQQRPSQIRGALGSGCTGELVHSTNKHAEAQSGCSTAEVGLELEPLGQ